MNDTVYCEGGVVLHPCCVGLLGECVVTTKENCSFQRGHWHPDKVRDVGFRAVHCMYIVALVQGALTERAPL